MVGVSTVSENIGADSDVVRAAVVVPPAAMAAVADNLLPEPEAELPSDEIEPLAAPEPLDNLMGKAATRPSPKKPQYDNKPSSSFLPESPCERLPEEEKEKQATVRT